MRRREEKGFCFVPNRVERALARVRERLPLMGLRVEVINGTESFVLGFWRGLRRLGFKGLARRRERSQSLEQRALSPPSKNAGGAAINYLGLFSPTNTLITSKPKNITATARPKNITAVSKPKNIIAIAKPRPKIFSENFQPLKKQRSPTVANVSR